MHRVAVSSPPCISVPSIICTGPLSKAVFRRPSRSPISVSVYVTSHIPLSQGGLLQSVATEAFRCR